MAELLSPDTFEFFARYLLAGFVVISVRGWFVTGSRPKPAEVFFDAVIFSLVNQAIFQGAVGISDAFGYNMRASDVTDARFFVEILILPTLLGAGLGFALSNERVAVRLRRFALPNSHPAERAYDFALSRISEPVFVIISFKDGSVLHGYFGQQSLAASDTNRSDILLERLYDVDDYGAWRETVPSRSVLVIIDDIRSIEFLRVAEDET